jgi:two-component system NtrC family sensor kinase
MANERILLVEGNPEISDWLVRQTLEPSGYQVRLATDVASAIQETLQEQPDLVITNLNLPGLSGKDLVVALSAQGLEVPVIVLAETNMEEDVIQAFRLGASDYLPWPTREAEVIAAVDRALAHSRAHLERQQLASRLEQTSHELQRRVRELTAISAVGKAVTGLTDLALLWNRIVEGAIYMARADRGWLLLRSPECQSPVLVAGRNIPKNAVPADGRPWEDEISALVVASAEPLAIHGEALRRHSLATLGKALLVVPLRFKEEVIGLLGLARREDVPFNSSDQTLLQAIADYAAIALLNASLIQSLESGGLTTLNLVGGTPIRISG